MPNQTLTAIIISPNRAIHDQIAEALAGTPQIEALWTLSDYPDRTAMADLRQLTKPCVVFLDFADTLRANGVAAEVDHSCPFATAIAVQAKGQNLPLMELMHLGIREVVKAPLTATDVHRAFATVGQKLIQQLQPKDQGGALYAFLPAKPGVGATTLATYGSAAAARLSERRALLLDFDFRLGMTSFLLQLNGNYSVLDALVRSQDDPSLLEQMVCRRGLLDILGSAPMQFGGVDPELKTASLLELARRTYHTVCVDLPGEMREYEIDTLRRATEFFLVTTPEIGALHMARRKAELIHSLGLNAKASVVLNRVDGRSISNREIETILQMPVRFTISSAERQLAEATVSGQLLSGRTQIVKEIEALAGKMTPGSAIAPAAKGRKFIEMFSVNRVRDRTSWGW